MQGFYDKGYVSTLNGRRHHYPLTRNQAINFPVQGLAADIVCEAMNTLSQYEVENGRWYLHPVLNVHDDLTFIVPDKLVDESVETICGVMLKPPYPFINVPMAVEVS